MARVKPLKIEEMPEELRSFFEVWVKRMGYIPNTLLTLARKPKIIRALAALSEAVHDPECSISPELRTMVGVLASYTHGCQYCLAHTAANAARVGMSTDKIDHIWEYETHPMFTEAERAALRFAQCATSVPNLVTDEQVEELRKYYNDTEIIEILAVVAYYGWYNRLNASLGTTLEEMPRGFAETYLKRTGWTLGHHG
jgi:uncharacterized peroxidase-related enzyme